MEQLKAAVLQAVAPSYCHGTVPLESSNGSVFFKKDERSEAKFINFAEKTVAGDEIQSLIDVSQRATFGRNDQDVLDESYRKAWKLDVSQFSAQFDVVSSGIIETVQNQLLRYETSTMTLEPHLYKLNVYGPGSFFKPHVDTPRTDKLFATLVVVLPTTHTGGNLLLGENGSVLNFDSSTMMYDRVTQDPQIAFAAFYSDVVHEVLPVISGYRVTLTYNLHLSHNTGGESIPRAPASESYRNLVNTLRDLAESSNILTEPEAGPNGIHRKALGFGLLSRYPIAIEEGQANLVQFTGALKGGDAMVRNACRELGFDVSVQVLYNVTAGDSREGHPPLSWISSETLHRWYFGNDNDPDEWRMADTRTTLRVKAEYEPWESETNDRKIDVHGAGKQVTLVWVTEPSQMVRSDFAFLAYGNEHAMGYVYGELVLIATPKERTRGLSQHSEVPSPSTEQRQTV